MNVAEARQALQVQAGSMREERVATDRLRFDGDSLRIGNERRALSQKAIGRMCRQVSAPSAYVVGLEPRVRSTLLQHHLERGDFDSGSVIVVSRGEECLGFARPDLCRLSGGEVLDAVLAGVGRTDMDVHSLRVIDDHLVDLELVSDTAAQEVAVGDIIRAGLKVTHSVLGEPATSVESFALRLVCRNGMTHRECSSQQATRTRRLPVDRADARRLQIEQVRNIAADTFASLGQRLGRIGRLQNERVEPQDLFARWLERARLSNRQLMPLLREAWQVEGGRPTAYDAMNALTRVATHATNLPLRQRRALAGLAGLLAFREWHLCPRCFSMLSSRAGSENEGGHSGDNEHVHHIGHVPSVN